MELQMQVSQRQKLSQKMIQSANILQMNALELRSYLEQLAMENPTVDLEKYEPPLDQSDDLRQKLEWLNQMNETNRVYYPLEQDDDQKGDFLNSIRSDLEVTLEEYLKSQLLTYPLSQTQCRHIFYIIECLDSSGYLKVPDEEMVQKLQTTPEEFEHSLRIVQSLDPAGVGARDLRECLLLQLEQLDQDTDIARSVVSDFLELLGKNQLGNIAKKLQASVEDVVAAFELIRSLNPKPGNSFSNRENLAYIVPDVTIVKLAGYFEILINEYLYPHISISPQYLQMLKTCPEQETKEYLRNKLKQTEWVMSHITQRNSTLLGVVRTILQKQSDFFYSGGGLHPLRLADVAQELSLHESTISRAVRDKYLQCSWGIYPLSFFFSKSIECGTGTDNTTPEHVQELIRELINEENKKKPLSDADIAKELVNRGVPISRRTVAKYRTACDIKNASGRKEY